MKRNITTVIWMIMALVAITVLTVPAAATVTNEGLTQLTDGPYREMSPSWSPDGTKIAYANQKSSQWNDVQIWIMDADGTNKRQITYGHDVDTTWSPDGEEIAFVRNEGFWYNIYKINVDGTGLTPLAADNSIIESHPNWSPDGSKILYIVRYSGSDVAEIWVMDADGSNKERLTTGRFDYDPSWNPDGTKIVYATRTNGDYDIWVMDADGTNQTRITDDPSISDAGPTWSPDGTMIAYSSDGGISSTVNIWVMNVDGSGKTKLTTDDTSYTSDWSPDSNKIVFYSGVGDAQGDVWVMTLGRTIVQDITFLTDTPEPEFTPIWTADGSQIMYVFQRTAWNERDSYLMNADGSGKERIYIGEGMLVGFSDLSPDGEELLLGKTFGYWYDVYKVNIDDGTLTPLAADSSKVESDAYWSPDGSRIVYQQRNRDSVHHLWLMDSDGSNKQQLGTSYNMGYGKDWSPDGSKIIYCARDDDDDELDLWMIDPDGANQVQITDTPYHEWCPSFSPDGQYIVYASKEGDTPDLWLRNIDGSYKVRLTYNIGIHDASPHWSPDGRKIVFVGNNWDNDHADIAVMTLGEINQQPTLTITSPAQGTIVSTSTVTITGTASSDTSSVASVTVNGVPATGTTNWNADVNLVEGENIITIIAKDLEHNKRTVKLQLFYYAHEDIHPLFSNAPQVEVGGTFYRWYMTTFRDSTIAIDSNYLDCSQPDENGVFNVSVNTSKHGITSPGTVDVLTYSASITKNGQTMQADTSLFNFTLNVLPRNYSTSWYLGSTIGGGGGIILYVEGEENTDFRMTTGNQDSILLMNRDINNKGTIGATAALFEAEAPGVNFGAVEGDIHGSIQEIYGSQVNVDYENAEDVQKLESSLYILTSTIPYGTNPMMAKTIDTVLNELTADLTTDYYESGVGISCGGSVDIVKVGFGLESTEEPARAKIGGADMGFGLGFEAGASLKNRTYPTIDSQEYLIQYVYSAEKGIHGSLLGNDIVDWGPSEYIDATVIMGQDKNKVLYGKVKIKDNEKPVMLDYVTKEITYDYGPIVDENIVNPFESDDIDTVSAFGKFIKNDKSFNQGNITVVETRGQKLAIEPPLGLTICGVKLSINPGIRMGNASNYLTNRGVIYNKEPYALEKYAYDTHVQGSAEELTHIVESLLEPVETVMEEVMETIKDYAEKGKKIIFISCQIWFRDNTYFFDTEDPLSSAAASRTVSNPTTQSDQTPEIIISTYTPDEPAPQTMAAFGAMGVSSGYATSLSGGDFVIGNITDLQPYNISFTPAAQLTLKYTEENVAGIDESNSQYIDGILRTTRGCRFPVL